MKPFRERNPILVGVISVAVLAALMLFALSLNRFPFLRGVYTVSADFADASGLTPDNEVRVAGLKVGKVKSVELASAPGGFNDRVRVTMEVKSSIKLGAATEAEIKLKTLLGSKFVDLTPKGGAPYVGDDEEIPLSRTRIPYEIYEVNNRTVESLGQVDAKALNDALRELGTLFDDPKGNLGRALDGLAKATEGLKDRDADLQKLVTNGAKVLRTLSERSQTLGRIIDSGGTILSALAARGDALARFVRGSDALASQLSSLLRSTRTDLDPALRDLHTTLEVLRTRIKPLEHSLEVLGVDAKSFGRVFTQGKWGDIWLQTVFDIPAPPVLPIGGVPSTSSGSALTRVLAEAAR